MIRYFGPASHRKASEIQIDTPIGLQCVLCEEFIAKGDTGTVSADSRITHYECEMRAIVGSVGHQLGQCPCFGGDKEDPEGMTYRQAAIAATRLWQSRQMAPRYRILRHTPARGFECLECGAVSYLSSDLYNRYCGKCHRHHQPHKLYEGRLLASKRATSGLDAQEQPRGVPAGARGYITTIMPGAAERPYAILFPSNSQTVVLASVAELLDPTHYELLED